MKPFAILLMCFLTLIPLHAIQVSGNQSGTWTVANNPYVLVGDVTVPNAQSLDIQAGVIVQSQGNFQINVQGVLHALGTAADSIYFGITADNTAGIWKGLRFETVFGSNELSYCNIKYAENGINSIAAAVNVGDSYFYGNTKGINCFGIGTADPPSVIITRCFIEYSKENGIFVVENRNVHISYCDISNNGVASTYRGAIQLSIQSTGANCSPVIQYNHIHHNRWQGIIAWDITAQGTMEPQISSNIIEYNYTGIYLYSSDGQVQNNQITNNFIPGNMNSGAGVMVYGSTSTPMFYQNTITGNYTGFYLQANANPCIGDLTEDVVTYWGRNTISNNIDANNVLHSIVLYQYTNSGIIVKAENNDFGTMDTAVIDASITDHNDNAALGTVDFMPLLVPVPVQSISGTITPLEGMLYCEVKAVPVNDSNPMNFISVPMNQDNTYTIPLETPGVYYVTAYGYMFEDINHSMCGAYGDVYEPQTVEVLLTSHVENIDITMNNFPEYLYTRIGESFQENNLTLYPLEQGLFVIPTPVVMNLYEDAVNDCIRIHSIILNNGTPTILTENNILIPEHNLNYNDTWNSTRMVYFEDIWQWQLIPITCTVVGNENIFFNDLIYNCWIIENRNAENELLSKEWYAYSLGVIKSKTYTGPFLYYKKNLQHVILTADNSFMPLNTGCKWFYFYERPQTPSELTYMPGDATNFFNWDPPIYNEVPWTHYKFYEDSTVLAQLPITQTNFGVLQDFENTHHYYVTAWREGFESMPSNTVTIEGVPNSDDTNTPVATKLSAYPNPCPIASSPLKISFVMAKSEPVTISIYNIRGQRVKQMRFDNLAKGLQEIDWDGSNESQKIVTDGVYIVKMEMNGKSATQKVVVLK